ncbi:MFS transporter [Sphingomonas populi]|uniref:MFS transporter n=1 Tax=Sphingomonas populi TaxID=2484750 RepID=A0A4Q6XTP0_9SPHN|nr:MFS transporter [Sphingomonas populi]RZF63650.1 MFS transporter [Sphingomonas populi]
MAQDAAFQSNRTIALSMAIGTGGLAFFAIIPIVMGSLVSAGRIDAAQLGWAATGSTLFSAAGMMLGLKVLKRSGDRWIVVAAGLVMALGNLAAWFMPNFSLIFWACSIAGVSQGVLVAVVALSIGYAPNPARLSGIFLAVSVPPPLLLAYFLPTSLMPYFGNGAGFTSVALVGVICAVCAFFIRDDFAKETTEVVERIRWSPWTVAALAGVLLGTAGFGAAWTYVDLLGVSLGLTPQTIGLAVSAAIMGQFIISALVAAIGWRLPMLKTLLAVSALQVIIALMLQKSGSPLFFTLLLTAFGSLWQGSTPFATGLLAALDESRRLAPLTLPLQLVGLALGPLVASSVASTNIVYVLLVAAGFYGLTLLTYMVVLCDRAYSDTATLKSVDVDPAGPFEPFVAHLHE